MRSFTRHVADLRQLGPVVEVVLGHSDIETAELAARGLPLPASLRVVAMIDTGASRTAIAPAVVRALGLQPEDVVLVSTASTTQPISLRRFDLSLAFPNGVRISSTRVIEAPLGEQEVQCLIGRDLLATTELVYRGRANEFTLSF